MAMNQAVRIREIGGPTVQEVVEFATSIGEGLGNNPEYKKTGAKRNSNAGSIPTTIAAIPQVTTNLRLEDFPRSHVHLHAPIAKQLRVNDAASDDGSIHHSPLASPVPIDAVAAFLNARPITSNRAA